MGAEKLPIVEVAATEKPLASGCRYVQTRRVAYDRLQKHGTRDAGQVEVALWRTFNSLVSGVRKWPLYLWGDTGRGKTFAGLCFRDVLANCAWIDLDRLCEILVTHDDGWWRALQVAECVVVDEIGGRDNVTWVDVDAVKKIADLRERYASRVAIYIGNHAPDRLKEIYGRRIFSRLCCGTTYELTGSDRRMA